MFFAILAIAVTIASTWIAYGRVRSALDHELERRLERVAETAASQIAPETVAGIHRAGEESGEYGEVQVQLVTLRTATGVDNAALIDSAGEVLVDVRSPEVENLPASLGPEMVRALKSALAGKPTASAIYYRDGLPLRAAFAPVRRPRGSVTGAVAIEAVVPYFQTLAELGRTLAVIVLVSAFAILMLAVLIVRASRSATRLERRLSRLENLAAMGRLTATLAHEIKNPLAIIRGSAERLRGSDPEAGRMAGFVIEEADRLSNTLSRYLQFARGEDEIHESGDAAEMLEATLQLLTGELEQRRVTLERSGRIAAAPVRLDNESLKQVYLNLILNALEAMPEGGRLRVAESERLGRFEIAFTDSGPGIAPDILKRMGSPFYTTKVKGSGLGLFLSRRLVQAAGGDLVIESEPGRGATCTVRLPRRKG